MPDAPSRIDYFEIGADDVLARSALRPPGQRIDPEQIFVPGSDVNLVIASASAMADEVTRQNVIRVNALFLDGARGPDLDRLVADRFSPTVVRKEATPAVGTVEFSRSSGAFPAGTVPRGTRVKTVDGIEYETLADATFALLQTGPVVAPVQAVDAGVAGNAAPLRVSLFSFPPFDTNLQVSNPESLSGGDDQENDARLRERARSFFLAARRGTIAAIEFGALTVPGVRLATAIESLDDDGFPTGYVALYISDAQGGGNASLVAAVRGALLEYRAAGVVVDIFAAQPLFVPIQLRLRFAANVDTLAAFDQVRIAMVANVNTLAPSRTLERSLLFQVARSVSGIIVLDDAIVSPAGDLVPDTDQVIRTRTDLITLVP